MKFSQIEKRRLRFLAAVSRLKRATGIPDCLGQGDHVFDHGWCGLYTTDADSAKVLANLMGNMLLPPHTEKFYSTRPGPDQRFLIEINQLGREVYEIKFPLRDATLDYRGDIISKMVQKLIAPNDWLTDRSR